MATENNAGFKVEIHYANCCGNAGNCLYPNVGTPSTEAEFAEFVKTDHVFFHFKNGYRSIDNFLSTEVVIPDCDNDHSDIPEDWITPEKFSLMFPDVNYLIYTSRHNMKQKKDKSPRPRFHIVFFGIHITDGKTYTTVLHRLQEHFPFFDAKAFDAGRFFFGNPNTEVSYHLGSKSLLQFLDELDADDPFADMDTEIPEGRRNSTMHTKAVRLLKRYGDSGEAYEMYLAESEKCSPPLEDSELKTIWNSAVKFYQKEIVTKPNYVPPHDYNAPTQINWEKPIPFDAFSLPEFPVDALPKAIADYVVALAESTQTPVDMAASSALPVISVCAQGKYKVRAKADWYEPVNTFVLNIMEPSERKSAVENAMVRPINQYESSVNIQKAAEIESSKMRGRILERRQKALEDQAAKGKDVGAELDKIVQEITDHKEKKPLRLYVDDVTTEKLTQVLSDNDGRAAILSTEGGIFDTLAGIYTKNVNIDVILKGYSGDCIKVDRIGRCSESVMDPALTILLMAQPSVLSGLMKNDTFRGRGLTARFLYCIPASYVGSRKYRSAPIPEAVSRRYEQLIGDMLEDEYLNKPEIITLSPEADEMIEAFAEELEPKLKEEYSDISDWAGKLIGNTHRIAGLLCRASVLRNNDFLDDPEPLVIDAATMANAIRIARYFTEHARAAFSLMGADDTVKQSKYILNAIRNTGLAEFNKRDIMRLCRSFKKADELQPVLDHLVDYGFIAVKETEIYSGKGRPPSQTYTVNPYIYENERAS